MTIHESIDLALAAAKEGRLLNNEPRVVVVHVGPNKHPVKAVDPKTWTNTAESQQFVLCSDGSLHVLPRYDWIKEPEVVEVDAWGVG